MKLLIVDPAGNGLDLAMRAQADGHAAKLYIRKSDKTQHIGVGLVDVVDDFKKWMKWADLIVNTDNTYYLQDLDRHRDIGPVIGATDESAQWELDRTVGMGVLRKHGIAVPPYEEFSDYDKAIRHVKKTMGRYVSKPSGDADKALSYVSKSAQDMVFMLERWKKLNKLKSPFILQEFIGGIEMAVGAWVGPDGFTGPWCENFEFKKLMNDDLGVATGEQGTIVRYVHTSKLAKAVLEPLEAALVRSGHTGYVDVNCIVDEDGQPWPLEFTMRFGWPTFNIQMELHDGDCVEWLMDIASGVRSPRISTTSLAAGVVLSIPDYPYSQMTKKEVVGIPIYGIKPRLQNSLHPCEMQMGEAPLLVGETLKTVPIMATAGDYVLVMTAIGETVQEATRRVYRKLKTLEIPNSPAYRTDIGNRLKKQLPELQKHGLAKGMEYLTPAPSSKS